MWRPVADGKNLPAGPSWPSAPEVSADVPLMIGSTATEMSMLMGTPRPELFDLDDAGMRKRLSAWFAPGEDGRGRSPLSERRTRTRRRAGSTSTSRPPWCSAAARGGTPT